MSVTDLKTMPPKARTWQAWREKGWGSTGGTFTFQLVRSVGWGQTGMGQLQGTDARPAVEMMWKQCPVSTRVKVVQWWVVKALHEALRVFRKRLTPPNEGCRRVFLQCAAHPASYHPLFTSGYIWIFLWGTYLSSPAIPELRFKRRFRVGTWPVLPRSRQPLLIGSGMSI